MKVKGGWAQKATLHGEERYRLYYYKRDAEVRLSDWTNIRKDWFMREFYHNFSSARDLGLVEGVEK